jgi:DNA-binding MarR family transcriptional regulator
MSTSPYAESILISLRRIIRAIDLHSRELEARFQLTVPQLVCLRGIADGSSNPSELSERVFLSKATVTGILNRLEDRGLIQRERKDADRRRVTVSLTEKGVDLLSSSPLPLQERFSTRLNELPPENQALIDRILRLVVEMMEAQELDASPYLAPAESLTQSDLPVPDESAPDC